MALTASGTDAVATGARGHGGGDAACGDSCAARSLTSLYLNHYGQRCKWGRGTSSSSCTAMAWTPECTPPVPFYNLAHDSSLVC